MSYDFLGLTNRVLKALNEVQLTSSTFASATGFHSEAQDAVNRAIVDIYTEEDNEWPFAWSQTTTTTTIGTLEYTTSGTYTALDWDSFEIKKPRLSVTSLTQTAGTATCTVSAGHQLITGDKVTISGATPDGYNGDFTVTVTNSTVFTYSVSSSLSSPASGTIIAIPPYSNTKLILLDYDTYRTYYRDNDNNVVSSGGYSKPCYIVRKPDNNYILSPTPDRIYSILYEGFAIPTALSVYTDVPAIPSAMEQVIVDKALHYAYMFRDNIEEANLAQDRYLQNIRKWRRELIPQTNYMRFSD